MSEKRRKAIEEQQGKGHYKDRESCIKEGFFPLYQSKIGDNYIHFLPPEKEDEYFGIRIFVHYGVGVNKGNILCNAKMYSTSCIICEEREEIYKEGKAGKEELRAMSSSPRYLFLILDVSSRENLKKGPQILLAPITIEDNIRKQCRDPKTGETLDISDPNPEEGRIFYFERVGSTMMDTDYLGFRLYPMDYEIPKSMLKGLPSLSSLLEKRSSDEVANIYRGRVGVGVGEEIEETQQETGGRDGKDRIIESEGEREKEFSRRDRLVGDISKRISGIKEEHPPIEETGRDKGERVARVSGLRDRLRGRIGVIKLDEKKNTE